MFARQKVPDTDRDWYWTASEADRREYDAFGPWVTAVENEQAMPPRFRPFWSENRHARFLLKVPVRADRVDMRPGMDLYRLVLAVHEDGVRLLRLANDRVTNTDIAWEEVAALRSFSDLLDARWILMLRTGETVEISYSAVSELLLDSVGAFVRDRLKSCETPVAPASAPMPVEVADLFFRNPLARLRADSPLTVEVLHSEPRDRLCRVGRVRLGLSLGLMVVDKGDELVIVDGGGAFRRPFEPHYAIRHTYLPVNRLTGYALEPPEHVGSAFRRLVLCLDQLRIEMACLDAPDGVVAALEARGIGVRAAA